MHHHPAAIFEMIGTPDPRWHHDRISQPHDSGSKIGSTPDMPNRRIAIHAVDERAFGGMRLVDGRDQQAQVLFLRGPASNGLPARNEDCAEASSTSSDGPIILACIAYPPGGSRIHARTASLRPCTPPEHIGVFSAAAASFRGK